MTALTFTVTLSRVMHSWLGTSIVTVRRSIFTMRSTIGRMTKRPGPSRAHQPAEAEDDAALVLGDDLHANRTRR